MEHMAVDERDPATILMLSEENEPGVDKRYLQGVLCLEAIVTVGKFAKTYPNKWDTFEFFLQNPELTQRQLAAKLGVSQNTVRLHIEDAKREIGHLILQPGGKKK